METAAFVSAAVFAFTSLILAIRQIRIRKELRSISNQLNTILTEDTNALITVSFRNKGLSEIVTVLNGKLGEMREKELALDSKNTEIGTAITNISHDLRTPLTSVRGYLDLMKSSRDIEEINKYIGIIDERTNAMKNLTEELFRYSLLITEGEIKKETVVLNNILEEALTANYTLLVEHSITPEINITEKRIEAELDRNHTSRIFGNIISNAAKYSDGDLYVSLADNGEIEFRNSAAGLDKIQVNRLFDRFYTVTNARTSTGLGLSIAKHFTELMGGTISASYDNGFLSIKLKF